MTEDESTSVDPGGREPDPAASMSLLTQLLANPLDSAYTPMAESEHHQAPLYQRLLVFLFAAFLGVGSVMAVSSLRSPADESVIKQLHDQAQSKQASVRALRDEVQSLSSFIDSTGGEAATGIEIPQSLGLSNALSPVSGPGITVVLKDSEDASALSRADRGAVRDLDLNVTVNALWGAGAEAVSINGICIGPGTFARTAGSVILVDITPVQSPYTITAIGDANALSVALVRGSTGDYLSSAKSLRAIAVSTAGARELTMPGRELRTTSTVHPTDMNQGG